MTQRPIAFVRDGDVPYQTIPVILAAGETREIPGALRYLLLTGATDSTKILISFNGAAFYNLPTGEQLQDFEAETFWIQNTDVIANAVTIVTGMASLNAQHVVIDSSAPITVSVSGTVTTSEAKLDPLAKSVYAVDSLATTNAANIKASAGRLYSLMAVNTTAAAKFVRLYDKATAPTVGTDIALRVIVIPANSSVAIDFAAGHQFSAGISIAITNAIAYNDATAVAAHDVQLAATFA